MATTKLPPQLKEIRAGAELVLQNTTSLLKSDGLQVVFLVVLQMGNFLNSGTNRVAAGFQLDTLNKLGTVKSFKSEQFTLAHQVADELRRVRVVSSQINLPCAGMGLVEDRVTWEGDVIASCGGVVWS